MATSVVARTWQPLVLRRISAGSSKHQQLLSPFQHHKFNNWQRLRHFSSLPPHEVMGLPSLSPTMESGSIASWNLKVGDAFNAGDSLCSVETDKATVDFEAQDEGVLAKILVEAGGDDVACGSPICITVEDEGDIAAFADYVPDTAAAPPPAAAEPTQPSAPEPAPSKPAADVAPPAQTPAVSSSSGGAVVASPLARLLAKELNFDIASIAGTGPGGRILAADVKEFTPSAQTASSTSQSQTEASPSTTTQSGPILGDGYTDYPLTASAQEVAARLAQSKRNVPHYYLTVDVSVDSLLDMRKKLSDDGSIGVYEFLLKAAAKSMATVPSANAAWMDSVVRVFDSVDINVVTGSGDSLKTALIPNVGAMGLTKISTALANAVVVSDDDGDDATSDPVDVSLGTFTVLNLGMYGVKSCAPIIREPQACALAIGGLENRIVPDTSDSGEIYKESVMFTATLSCDHRVVDGAVGAQWLAAFKSHVENPTSLLL